MTTREFIVFAPDVPEKYRKRLTIRVDACFPYSAPLPRFPFWSTLIGTIFSAIFHLFLTAVIAAMVASVVAAAVMFVGWLLTLIGLLPDMSPDTATVIASIPAGILAAVIMLAGVMMYLDPTSDSGAPKALKAKMLGARAHHRRYLRASDLDEPSQALMERARKAITAVLDAEVTRDGLLDEIANAVILPDEQWQIAELLQRQTALRTKLDQYDRMADTPELDRVLDPQLAALDQSVREVTGRIEALERYADLVARADSIRASERLDDDTAYLDLLAHTADTTAVASLAEHADLLGAHLTETLQAGRAITPR
ncbi:hypothetical protein [Actinocorallia libanotica]|uniref:5-bromo-4-chloroindolyl phosphate hydrolysis protein n=1 Tax=Actinocorallia libanotica TaxID=46162 RepID=A0ABN1QSY9_9ACTN